MKTTFPISASALVAGLLVASTPLLRADDPPATVSTNPPPRIELTLSTPPAALSAADAKAVELDAVPAPSPSPAVPALTIGTAVPAETPLVAAVGLEPATSPLTTQPQSDVQRRLEAPKPEELIAKHGTAGFLIRQPTARNFLDVINPFAPASFGPKPRETYNRDPNLKPGASLPRTFVSDGIKNEPEVNLLSWPW